MMRSRKGFKLAACHYCGKPDVWELERKGPRGATVKEPVCLLHGERPDLRAKLEKAS